MGTRFELVIPHGQDDCRAAGEAALEEILQWHQRLNRFAPDSLVGHLQRVAPGTRVPLDRDSFALFQECRQVSELSGGAFDPTLGGGLDGWVLDPSTASVIITQSGISWDFGAIAKGHALDSAARVLIGAGITSALLHGGTSSVVAIGTPPDLAAWRVAIAGSGAPPAVVELVNQALAVSSQRERDHLVDGRTGAPVHSGADLVVVTGPSARSCDAWSTALLVLGEEAVELPEGYRSL